ncbi:hypothetical protein GOHSU_18_00170 [Gordonia hirsuta DSM 44140 = NBRC 16056]|uniref:Serine/threonine protein kinase n=1 Tax=Gordonia hirsuta DSM 44140 = NBRC 16056 TaxID=1121927 RepID=L7LB21_9ACTN|nr:hypothetical protein [Gordonia hirsuta]GAC57262.1 hypothetical protein GOHSU_18_00170 [Gordonia hirsuta DSM 44140 = NBRC 16056]
MSRSLPHSTTGLARAWPVSALAVWAAAWRAGRVAPDDVLHTLQDYAQSHELDVAPDSGLNPGGTALDLVALVGQAPSQVVLLPSPGDLQGLPPGPQTGVLSSAEEVLLLERPQQPPLALTARGSIERCRWSVRALAQPLDLSALGGDRGLGEMEYELREATGEAAVVIAALSGPRAGGPADLRDALTARTRTFALELPPHDRPRADRVLASAAQLEAIIELAGAGPGVSAEQLEAAAGQLRRLSALTRRARAAAVNDLLREYRRDG